jgi:hypothetical protein
LIEIARPVTDSDVKDPYGIVELAKLHTRISR